ncbi:hypothetical protein SAMN05421812_13128 [Asanoa hainanensis]|uniref:Uncharacterized protein n=1 Tax=Asanoa hainanensis TaxID=560556 RepID=A0A239PGF0_9ACTN|nr:hypothetical protein [Asanoa hainanensis]SNT66040.1 hypothetical protein SAMN05421812_13128 [Asanoa hainanensis]
MGLWNLATDVAYSTGQPWNDRGRLRNQCYDKLFAAAVPWVYGQESYRPIWSPRQLSAMRATLGQAVHLLRVGIA